MLVFESCDVLKLRFFQFQNIFSCIALIGHNTVTGKIIFKWNHVCTFLRKLCKFPHLESCTSDWQFRSEMWLHWPGDPCDTIFWNDHSRKESYSSQFALGKLTTEEDFSVLTGTIITALVFKYAVAPLRLDVRFYFPIPKKRIWGLAYHFSNITIFI